MPKRDYPSAIDGVRFLKKRELPPVSTCWDFQTVEMFPIEFARRLFNDLPEDCEISFFDPEAGQEEAWVFVRREGQRYLVQRVRHGSSTPWSEQSLSTVLTSFSSSPLVQKPSGSFESFTVSCIPDHQRYEHINGKA
jgi:hypothetical protein